MKYTVYVRTNKINGKQYVGQTNNIEHRNNFWKSNKSIYANKELNNDRFKYGLENWTLRILAEVETREEAWKLEEKFVKELNTKSPNGYNRAFGGRTNKGGNVGYHNGKEFKKGDEPWNKGVKGCFSDETLKKMSENKKGKHNSPSTEFKKGITSWIKGKHHTAESNEKNRLAHLGKILPTRKPIIQLTLDGKYIKETFLKDAAKELGFKSDESIRKACKENCRTSGGFRWMYKSDYEEMLAEQTN